MSQTVSPCDVAERGRWRSLYHDICVHEISRRMLDGRDSNKIGYGRAGIFRIAGGNGYQPESRNLALIDTACDREADCA